MRTQISGKEIDQDEGLFLFYLSIRDRGFIYWRLLSTDPAAAKDVVLAEKPLIAEETDLLEPTLLDELICHIASLASVYHKPPSAFVEGKVGLKRMLPARGADTDSDTEVAGATIIPEPGSLIGDLLDMDLHPRDTEASEAAPAPDLLGGDFFQLPQFEKMQNESCSSRWIGRAFDWRPSCFSKPEHQQLAWRHIWNGRQCSHWICSCKAGDFPFLCTLHVRIT